jgi:hypothetical protein
LISFVKTQQIVEGQISGEEIGRRTSYVLLTNIKSTGVHIKSFQYHNTDLLY